MKARIRVTSLSRDALHVNHVILHPSMSTKTLNYIIAQTRQNISLLQELERVSRQDADLILSKLPLPSGSPHAFIARAKFNYNEDGKVFLSNANSRRL